MSFHNGFVRKAISAISALAISSVPCLAGKHIQELENKISGLRPVYVRGEVGDVIEKALKKMNLKSLDELFGQNRIVVGMSPVFDVFEFEGARYPSFNFSFLFKSKFSESFSKLDFGKIGDFAKSFMDEFIARETDTKTDTRKIEILNRYKTLNPVVTVEIGSLGEIMSRFSFFDSVEGNLAIYVHKSNSDHRTFDYFTLIYDSISNQIITVMKKKLDHSCLVLYLIKRNNPALFKEWCDEGALSKEKQNEVAGLEELL